MYRIGIDLGGTNIAVGVVDDRHQIVAEASLPAGAHRPAEQVVADMCRAAELALDKAGLTAGDCVSIGVGAPGTCDPARGVVVCAYNLNWFDVPVCAMLTKHFALPARLSNDANCAALAEVVAGAAVLSWSPWAPAWAAASSWTGRSCPGWAAPEARWATAFWCWTASPAPAAAGAAGRPMPPPRR